MSINRLPRAIWALGIVSMFMDISSELIHSLLPVFMVSTLGASVAAVGWIEGIAEATALITKIFSGTLSDYLGKRKLLTLIGYSMAAFTKPLFPLAHSLNMVVAARFIDRIGKGIRGAPRDALIGDITPLEQRGAAFGLRQSMDTVGAFIGPILAIVLMASYAGNIRIVLWLAVIPAFIAVTVLAFGVKEPPNASDKPSGRKISLRDLHYLRRPYWQVVFIAALMSLARFSEAFLLLKAQSAGVQATMIPMVMVVMNIIYALAAYPAGKLSDRMDRKSLLLASIPLLVAADLVLATGNNRAVLGAGVCLWGLHLAFSQGLLSAMITDHSPPELRGSAFGIYNLVCGIALLAASAIAGMLWDAFSPAVTFYTGAGCAICAFTGLIFMRKN